MKLTRTLSPSPQQRARVITRFLPLGVLLSVIMAAGIMRPLPPMCYSGSYSEMPIPFSLEHAQNGFWFQGTPSTFYYLLPNGSIQEFGSAYACPDGRPDLKLSGIGFRASQQLLYGSEIQGDSLIRLYSIDAKGSVRHVAQIALPSSYRTKQLIACMGHEQYFVYAQTSSQSALLSLALKELDEHPGSSSLSFEVYELPPTLNTLRDLAYHPLEDALYTCVPHRQTLQKLRLDAGKVSYRSVAALGTDAQSIKKLYVDRQGTVHALLNTPSDSSTTYFRPIYCPRSLSCPEAPLMITQVPSEASSLSAFTYYAPMLSREIHPTHAMPGDTLRISFLLRNPNPWQLEGVSLSEQLPDSLNGFFIAHSLRGLSSEVGINAYGESPVLELKGLEIPAADSTAGELAFSLSLYLPKDSLRLGNSFACLSSLTHLGQTQIDSFQGIQTVAPVKVKKKQLSGAVAPKSLLSYQLSLHNPYNGGLYTGSNCLKILDSLSNAQFIPEDSIELESSLGKLRYASKRLSLQQLQIEGIELLPGESLQINYQVRLLESLRSGDQVQSFVSTFIPKSSIYQRQQLSTEVVPVEFLSFEVEQVENRVRLNWATGEERDNAGFYIEYMQNGQSYQEMAFVPGQDNTESTHEYQYTSDPLNTNHYIFRLKQKDHQGHYAYSNPVELHVEARPLAHIRYQLYPNPASSIATLKLLIPQNQETSIQLATQKGKALEEIFKGDLKANQEYTFALETAALNEGKYLIKIQGEQFRKKLRLWVQRNELQAQLP